MKKHSFTLIELLTVIAIIAILAGLLMPAVNGARSKARATQCTSNLKNIGMAFIQYCDDYKGFVPPALSARAIAEDRNRQVWSVAIYPYIGLSIGASHAELIKSVLNCPSGVFDSAEFNQDLSNGFTTNPLFTDVNGYITDGLPHAIQTTPSIKLTRVKYTSTAFMVSDACCNFGNGSTTAAPMTISPIVTNVTAKKYLGSTDSSLKTKEIEVTYRNYVIPDIASYDSEDTAKLKEVDWVHSNAINVVCADGHCGSIKGEAGITYGDVLPY